MNRGIANCETARRLMETNDPALAQHLLSCLSCIMRTQARYYEAPPGLEEKIRRNLRRICLELLRGQLPRLLGLTTERHH